MNSPYHPARVMLPTLPDGTEVASYRTYAEAQAAVDQLSDAEHDVSVLTIVGTDLRLVERITGRLTLGKVIANGALSGMWMGLFFSALLAMWSPNSSLFVIAAGVGMGALFGIVLNVVPYLLRRGERDFTSATQVVAARYAVMARANVDQFRTILARTTGNLTRPQPAPRPVEDSGPTAFGSRPDEQPKYGVRVKARPQEGATDQTPPPAGADRITPPNPSEAEPNHS